MHHAKCFIKTKNMFHILLSPKHTDQVSGNASQAPTGTSGFDRRRYFQAAEEPAGVRAFSISSPTHRDGKLANDIGL